MISKQTAAKIYNCHFEIEKAEKLIADMLEVLQQTGEMKLKNAFGDAKGLQLGVPSGNDSHRLFNVPPDLAVSIIEAHIKEQKRILSELSAVAKIELYGEV